MKKLLLPALFALSAFGTAQAQTASSFESLSLPSGDTAYINYSQPGKDVGFDDGLAHFPCVYDTSSGFSFWSNGFAYSNKKDSVTGSFSNQYSARPGKAAVGTQYAVAYGKEQGLRLLAAARGKGLSGMWVTNSTYAYKTMRDGDAFSRKFGDTTGTKSNLPQGSYPDFFKLTIRGYLNGAKKADSVDFYLADYRAANAANDYIVNDWKWVSLTSLGNVDSVAFELSSSDNSEFGMNTPAYFCLDEFTTNETGVNATGGSLAKADLKIYPNPATTTLWVEDAGHSLKTVSLLTAGGQLLRSQTATGAQTEVDVQGLPAGMYYLILEGTEGRAMHTFLKN